MEQIELGRTGVRVPIIGFGAWKYRGGPEPLLRALELGANLVDTAENYGTEDAVGLALKGHRSEFFLATKVSGNHLRRRDVLQAAEASLRRLGVDYIDLYQVHWPDSGVPVGETMGALEDLVNRGSIRFIGVSNFSLPQLQEAQDAMTRHPIVANQVLYNLMDRDIEADLLPYCQQHGVTVIAYSPLAEGQLASLPQLRRRREGAVLEQIARDIGKTPAQVALNWCIGHPGVLAIPKTDKVQRVDEDCGAAGWRLAPERVAALDRAFR